MTDRLFDDLCVTCGEPVTIGDDGCQSRWGPLHDGCVEPQEDPE